MRISQFCMHFHWRNIAIALCLFIITTILLAGCRDRDTIEAPAALQREMIYTVIDASTNAVITNAVINVPASLTVAQLDSGVYRISAQQDGTFVIAVSASGYDTQQMTLTFTAGQFNISQFFNRVVSLTQPPAELVLHPAGGTVTAPNNIKITIPPAKVDHDTPVSILALPTQAIPVAAMPAGDAEQGDPLLVGMLKLTGPIETVTGNLIITIPVSLFGYGSEIAALQHFTILKRQENTNTYTVLTDDAQYSDANGGVVVITLTPASRAGAKIRNDSNAYEYLFSTGISGALHAQEFQPYGPAVTSPLSGAVTLTAAIPIGIRSTNGDLLRIIRKMIAQRVGIASLLGTTKPIHYTNPGKPAYYTTLRLYAEFLAYDVYRDNIVIGTAEVITGNYQLHTTYLAATGAQ